MAAFVARGSKPTSGEAERSGERDSGGLPPDYVKTFRQRGGGDECKKAFRRCKLLH
jgi:hypothetical protein